MTESPRAFRSICSFIVCCTVCYRFALAGSGLLPFHPAFEIMFLAAALVLGTLGGLLMSLLFPPFATGQPYMRVLVGTLLISAPISLVMGFLTLQWLARGNPDAGLFPMIGEPWLYALNFVAVMITVVLAYHITTRLVPSRPSRLMCPECQYDLAGLTAPGCPECGWGRPEDRAADGPANGAATDSSRLPAPDRVD